MGSCGWLRLAKIVRMDFASFALWKGVLSSASAAEERTLRMMEERTRIVPLMGGGLSFKDSAFSGVAEDE